MMISLFRVLVCITFILAITSCMLIAPSEGKSGKCRTLKSDIIFNGSTSNDRQANLDNAQATLQQHNYEMQCT